MSLVFIPEEEIWVSGWMIEFPIVFIEHLVKKLTVRLALIRYVSEHLYRLNVLKCDDII